MAIFIVLGVWVCNNVVTYWIEAGGIQAQSTQALNLFMHDDTAGAVAQLEPLLTQHPQDARTRLRSGLLYAQGLAGPGRTSPERRFRCPRRRPASPVAGHTVLAATAMGRGRCELRKAVELGPDDADAAWLYARALERQGNAAAAIDACRNVLRIDPYKADVMPCCRVSTRSAAKTIWLAGIASMLRD